MEFVTITNTMGCQKLITQKIVDKSGDYLISLKGTPGNLHKNVKMNFKKSTTAAFSKWHR